jgi:tetratricopeptide (TPR) repeat protein
MYNRNMPRKWLSLACLSMVFSISKTSPQESHKAVGSEEPNSAARAIAIAEKGRCSEALPLLESAATRVTDKETKRQVGLATVRCAMKLDLSETAVGALTMLNRDFPGDPDVLYVTTHAYSDLATRASQKLALSAPSSYQAAELYAESLEVQGKWKEAADEYQKILAAHPDLRGIHYRLGRVILSEPPTPTMSQDATREFEAELKIDPHNADAEYIVGELARQSQNWDDAIRHLSQATKLDPTLAIAYLGLGMSLNSAGKFADSVAPLEKYVRMMPKDPAGHYQLAIACARTGRDEEAAKEMALQRGLANQARESQAQNATQKTAQPQ